MSWDSINVFQYQQLIPALSIEDTTDQNMRLIAILNGWTDNQVDSLSVEDYAKEKAKLTKKMEKGILIGNDYSYRIIGFKVPLIKVWTEDPNFFSKTLKDSLDKYAKNGHKLLNTNIPQQFLN